MLAFHLKGQQRWRPCLSLSPTHCFRWVSSLAPRHPTIHIHATVFSLVTRCLPSSVSMPMPGTSLATRASTPLPLLHLSSQQDGQLKLIHTPPIVRAITIFPAHSLVDPVQLSRSFLSAALLACLLGATSPSSPYLVNLACCSRQESLEVALAKSGFGEATLEALASDCGRAQPLLAIP